MRLLCPNCHKSITVPDADAGKTTHCPECGHSFQAPELFSTMPPASPAALEPAPTNPEPITPVYPPRPTTPMPPPPTEPGGPLPPSAQPAPPEPSAGAAPTLADGTRFYSVRIAPHWIRWVPAVCLSLAFLLTLFKWVGAFPAGYTIYSQNAWQALFANFSTDRVGEEKVFHKAAAINERIRPNMWLLPYFLVVIAAIPLAWAIHFAAPERLPSAVRRVWHHRARILTGLAVAALVLLLLQMAVGFGLKEAIRRLAADDFAAQPADVAHPGRTPDEAKTPEEEKIIEIGIARELGQYHLGGTWWLDLVLLAHVLAVAAIAIEHWLIRRGNRPVPRIGMAW
jgi:predicted Zn finger-like uncharacterized protein